MSSNKTGSKKPPKIKSPPATKRVNSNKATNLASPDQTTKNAGKGGITPKGTRAIRSVSKGNLAKGARTRLLTSANVAAIRHNPNEEFENNTLQNTNMDIEIGPPTNLETLGSYLDWRNPQFTSNDINPLMWRIASIVWDYLPVISHFFLNHCFYFILFLFLFLACKQTNHGI